MVDYNEIMGALGEDLPQQNSIIQGLPDSGPTKNPYSALLELLRDDTPVQVSKRTVAGVPLSGVTERGGTWTPGPAMLDNWVREAQEELFDQVDSASPSFREAGGPVKGAGFRDMLRRLGGIDVADYNKNGAGKLTRLSPMRLLGGLYGLNQAGSVFPGTLEDLIELSASRHSGAWPFLDDPMKWMQRLDIAQEPGMLTSAGDEFGTGFAGASNQLYGQAGWRFGINDDLFDVGGENIPKDLARQLQELEPTHSYDGRQGASEFLRSGRGAAGKPHPLFGVKEGGTAFRPTPRANDAARIGEAFRETFAARSPSRSALAKQGMEVFQPTPAFHLGQKPPSLGRLHASALGTPKSEAVSGALRKALKGGVKPGMLSVPLAIGGGLAAQLLGSKIFGKDDDSFNARTARAVGLA